MREDMFKIIVERPRRGWRSAPRARGRLSGEDDLPVKIGMKRHVAVTKIGTKWLNENLQPLKRYLAGQVGRPWNDVFSEIAATLAPGHTVKEHVRAHLEDFVAKIAIGRDGEWLLAPGSRLGRTSPVWHQPYYVDPLDGVLKQSSVRWRALGIDPAPRRKKRLPERDPHMRRIDENREHRRIEGVWYEIGYARDPKNEGLAFDLVKRAVVPAHERHAAAKRQLSAGELRALGLSNEWKI